MVSFFNYTQLYSLLGSFLTKIIVFFIRWKITSIDRHILTTVLVYRSLRHYIGPKRAQIWCKMVSFLNHIVSILYKCGLQAELYIPCFYDIGPFKKITIPTECQFIEWPISTTFLDLYQIYHIFQYLNKKYHIITHDMLFYTIREALHQLEHI